MRFYFSGGIQTGSPSAGVSIPDLSRGCGGLIWDGWTGMQLEVVAYFPYWGGVRIAGRCRTASKAERSRGACYERIVSFTYLKYVERMAGYGCFLFPLHARIGESYILTFDSIDCKVAEDGWSFIQ